MTSKSSDGRFFALVKRELTADDVRILSSGASSTDEAPNMIRATLPDGRIVVATFAEAPADRDALRRRFQMLASSFSESAREQGGSGQVVRSLREELRSLAQRAMAENAIVLDAQSPLVWGSARVTPSVSRPELEDLRDVSTHELARLLPAHDVDEDESPLPPRSSLPPSFESESHNDRGPEPQDARTARVLFAVRALPQVNALRSGKPFAHTQKVEDGETGFVVHSFGGIYMLVLVFAEAFDELRAERATKEALPRIERLVLSLPPHDPDDSRGNVVSLKRPRRA
ncbi:MAG: hypothetical protein U0174_19345 [Polyangiaceae bacterium]